MALPPIQLSNVALGSGGFVIRGRNFGDQLGFSLASAGDVNGDGFDDLIVSAPRTDGDDVDRNAAGSAYLVFGRAGGFAGGIDLQDVAGGTGGFVLHGAPTYDRLGFSIATAGDINGDGLSDLVIGAPYARGTPDDSFDDDNGYGASYVVFGRSDGQAPPAVTSPAFRNFGFVIVGDVE